ncbi:MAG: 50S ribosomal protein L18 [Candidatus Woesearchaeota archaeon]
MKTRSMPYRRKFEGRTNYKKRLKLLLSNKPRLVIRKSNKHISLQLIDYTPEGDVVIAQAHSGQLKKYGIDTSKNNIPSAYLTGMLLGKMAKAKKIKEAVLDIGLYSSTKGSRLYAALKGAMDAGLYVMHSEEILPSKERIAGNHMQEHAKAISKQAEKYAKYYSNYLKQKVEALQITQYFNTAREKIQNETNK